MKGSIMPEITSNIKSTSSAGSSTPSSSGTNFAAGAEEALRILLSQLLGGGTPEQRTEAANRATEVQAVRGQRGDYSKEAAFTDAQGVMAQQTRLAMEKLLPSLVRSAEGAGTSQNSMRALLLQDAANKSAESASALGLKASVDYGSIGSGLSQILASLTQQNSPVTKALIDAINLSKGQTSTGATTASSGSSMASSDNNLPRVNHNTYVNPFSNLMQSNLSSQPTQRMSSTLGNDGWQQDNIDQTPQDMIGASNPLVGNNGRGAGGWSDYTF